ncbi:MAG TPA: multidrug effflux MFS transporter [Xanthobacteraceae bacterium]|jgi:DHA1 family bicyclomycin/chloramphenicol resistance-like MFS transporter|nr:multidrug effflux MFS transporter [Xanthobacteraceae bacterium]
MLQPGTFGLTLLLAMLTALGPLSMDMYLPSLPDIAHVLGAPVARTQLTISSYLIGFAVGQMIYGPLSDRYGRRPVLLAAVALYLASTLACAAAQSVDLLIAARLLQGISGSGAIVLARAIVRDVYSGVQAARELSLMGSISATAPIVAPMIGGVLQAGFGWRANFICMSVGGLIALLVAGRLLPETLRPDNRASPLSFFSMMRGYGAVARHRGFLVYLGIITTTYAGLFAWVSGASVVLQGVYGLSAVAFGFTFALGAAGYMLGAMIATRLVVRLGLDRTIGVGVVVIAAGGLSLALAVATGVPGLWLVAAMALYLAGVGLAMPQAMAGALTPFPDRAGTAASLMGLVQQALAAVIAAVIGAYLVQSAWPVTGVVVAMGCLTFLLWALTRGMRARAR